MGGGSWFLGVLGKITWPTDPGSYRRCRLRVISLPMKLESSS